MLRLKFFQGFVHRKQLIIFRRSCQSSFPEFHFDALAMTAVPLSFSLPRTVYENPPHGFRRQGNKVVSVFELLLTNADQFQPCLVDKRSRLEGLPRRFVGHLVCREAPQLVIHKCQQRF